MGSGHAVEIREILDKIVGLSDTEVSVELDPEKVRPVDVPVIEAAAGKLTDCTGWTPEIPLETTLKETLDYWRDELKNK